MISSVVCYGTGSLSKTGERTDRIMGKAKKRATINDLDDTTLVPSYNSDKRQATSWKEMALSAPKLPPKQPISLLVLTALLLGLFSESKAFQSRYFPDLRGASFCHCRRPSRTTGRTPWEIASSQGTRHHGLLRRRREHRIELCSKSTSDTFLLRLGDDDEREDLTEEENPMADFDRKSRSGVRYGSVFDGLYILYPQNELERRNAVSRSDGYWPFINNGQEPPKQYTYGEFDLYFFAELLDRALDYYSAHQTVTSSTWDDKVFTDIGSGTGRLVFAAAALHPGFELCRGVEVLEGIHNVALETLEKCRYVIEASTFEENAFDSEVDVDSQENNDVMTAWKPFDTASEIDDWLDELKQRYDGTSRSDKTGDNNGESERENQDLSSKEDDDSMNDSEQEHYFDQCALPTRQDSDAPDEPLLLAPIQFTCGSFEDPYEYIGDSDLIYVFSSCMSNDMMSSMSKAFGRQCKPGTIIITTDYSLPLNGDIEPLKDDKSMPHGPYKLELLESIDGWCWLTGGQSTAHIHRVVSSLWEEGVGPRQRPVIPLEEKAYRVVKAYEAGELTDTSKFLREVRNNMIFLGLPESWYSSLGDE